MTNSIIKSTPAHHSRANELMKKKTPNFRKAYSDRTAWLMACFSELAYLRFNPLYLSESQQFKLLGTVNKLLGSKKISILKTLLTQWFYDHSEEKQLLIDDLGLLNFELIETFDIDGTQAILVSCDEFSVLAFRGTEASCIKDVKTDLRAKMTECETGGKIHTGFKEAFEKVESLVQSRIDSPEINSLPLFITGHSLGGALATVAAKKLNHSSGIAACYTFGSPRVGDDQWISGMKSPVYRVVNAADCVTMMPPRTTFISTLCWIVKRIPAVGEGIRSWLARFGGYLHCGDMRYLTNCKSGAYDQVRLLFYVNFLYRIKGFLVNNFRVKKFVKDHSISVYRKKLMYVAEKRNQG